MTAGVFTAMYMGSRACLRELQQVGIAKHLELSEQVEQAIETLDIHLLRSRLKCGQSSQFLHATLMRSMFSSNEEFFTFVRDLQQRLLEHGEDSYALELRASLSSSVLSEIFGRVRACLRELQQVGVAKRLGISEQIEQVIDSLNTQLGGANRA